MYSKKPMMDHVNTTELPRLAFLALGSNLGDRWWIMQGALEEIGRIRGYRVLDVAPVWETPPWGELNQPHFLNTVVALEILGGEGSPETLLREIQQIEVRFGRVRGAERWGPRTLDIDLLLWDQEVRSSDGLELPHPRICERAFVTVPLGFIVHKHQDWPHEWLKQWRAVLPAADGVFGGPSGHLRFP